jgi:hypothetical protein
MSIEAIVPRSEFQDCQVQAELINYGAVLIQPIKDYEHLYKFVVRCLPENPKDQEVYDPDEGCLVQVSQLVYCYQPVDSLTATQVMCRQGLSGLSPRGIDNWVAVERHPFLEDEF